MTLRSEAIERWWPVTQSLDLVEAPLELAAQAVRAEVARILRGEELAAQWAEFPTLDAALGAARIFANVPTFYLAMPSNSKWTVLWNNSFLADGYDSLCWCLSSNHRLTTVHWSAHDEWTTFQSGASFCYRRWEPAGLVERSVYACQEDKRWLFYQSGSPLAEEDLAAYRARRKRDRLNERLLAQLLGRLGARPWQEDFYALPGRCFVLERTSVPSSVLLRTREEVVGRTNNQMQLTAPAQAIGRRS